MAAEILLLQFQASPGKDGVLLYFDDYVGALLIMFLFVFQYIDLFQASF